jgi:Leucine-rich repeat (LRR) protein
VLFQNLKELYIENNHLEYLPESLGSMPNLEVLDCRHNLLKQLPDTICQAQGEEAVDDSLIEVEASISHGGWLSCLAKDQPQCLES